MFSRFFIYRPVFAGVISIVIVLAGLITVGILSVEKTPDITPPTVKVTATYPGASASVIADTVATPIEQQVNGVEDMIYMSSKSSDDGKMELTVTFEVGTDIDMATVLVQNRVSIAEPQLPEEVRRQGITVKKQSTNITLLVNLVSPDGSHDELYLSNYINLNIKDVLSRVPGVGEIVVFGAKDFGMRIWLDPNRLAARSLTTNDIVAALQDQNVQVAAGQIGAEPAPKGQNFQYTVNTQGRLSSVEQFEDIVIKTSDDGHLLRLKDVARVELGAQAYNMYVELNGAPSIALGVYQLPGANALAVADGIKAEMEKLSKNFETGVEYQIVFDTTLFVTSSIKEVVVTLFVAAVLVVLTVYVFLQDLRITLIPTLTIPVALIGTLAVMMPLDMSINTLSLFGLVLAIGIVVDDSILVVENTMRIIDGEGLPAKEATEKALLEITGPVIATTLVLLAVFIPSAMISGITGRLYQQFALTIATATVFSSINALTLSPALCGMLLRPSSTTHGVFFTAFNKMFDLTTKGYSRFVGALLRKTAIVALVLGGFYAATVWSFIEVPGGFIPDEDQGYFFVNVQLPDGATLQRTTEVMDRVSAIVAETDGVADTITIGGYTILDSQFRTNGGCCFVVLDPWDDRTSREKQITAILQSVYMRASEIEEAVTLAFMPPPIDGLGNAGGFELQLQDRAAAGMIQLEAIASDLVVAGDADPELTRMNSNLQTNVPQLYLEIDRTKTTKEGVPLQTVFSTLQAYLGSLYVNDFNLFGRVYKVMVQADHPFRSRVDDINRLQVRNRFGDMIPLSTLLAVEETVGPQTISHFNLYPSATITGQASPGYSSGQAITAMERISRDRMPSSMGYEWSGVTYQQLEAGNQVSFVFGIAFVFVFLFLAAQYESWSIPLAVICSVPLAIFGAMIATWMRALDNNIYTQIGLVLLIGLASKSAIMIVEFAKQRRAEGLSIIEAADEAARLRFRPILMTAFSFILGVFPLVIATGAGAASRRALGTAVFGGMLLSTLLGIFITPVLYVIIQRLSEWRSRPPKT